MSFNYTREFISSGLTYSKYQELIKATVKQPANDEAAEKMLPHVIKNLEFMMQYDESYHVSEELKASIMASPEAIWLVITEGWCGDAAFNVPMMAAIEKAVPSKVQLRLFLRDSNPELIDANLTDGGRSIPKLVILSREMEKLGEWGPRPAGLKVLMKTWKEDNLSLKEIIPKVHDWYNNDETRSLQQELILLAESYKK